MKSRVYAMAALLIPVMAFAEPPVGTGPDIDSSWIPDNSCPSQTSRVVKNICTTCFFPIRLGVKLGGGGSGSIPNDKYGPVCACPTWKPPFIKVGVTGGIWTPDGILETTPREWCSSTLGGTVVKTDLENRGIGHWSASQALTYNNVHHIPFPMGQIAGLLMGLDSPCSMGGGDWGSVGMWSELDPTWNDPKLAAFKSPEGVASGGAQAALVNGCVADYASMKANSNYFGVRQCAGMYGQMYPISGYSVDSGNPATQSALGSARLLDEMHRLGMQKKTWGSYSQVCKGEGKYVTAIPKNGHRFQQVAPQGEKKNHRIGDTWSAGSSNSIISTIRDSSLNPLSIQGHEINNNNYIHIDWKYKECCVGI